MRQYLYLLLLFASLGCGIRLRVPALSEVSGSLSASQLAFTQVPGSSVTANALFSSQPIVEIQDSKGNRISSADPSASDSIQLTAYGAAGCTGSALTSFVSDVTPASAGLATFSKVYNTAVQTVYLKATDLTNPSINSACYGPIAVTFPTLNLVTYQAASYQIGYPDLDTVSPWSVDGFHFWSAANSYGFYQGKFYVPDPFQHRILGYHSLPAADFQGADFVLGQPNFTSTSSGSGLTGYNRPWSISILPTGETAVTDTENHRVLIYKTPPTATATPDYVFGQPNFTTYSSGCSASSMDRPVYVQLVGRRMIVNEYNSYRILVWNDWAASGSGSPADMVIGQPDFTSCSMSPAFNSPVQGVNYSPTWGVWTDGTRLVVGYTSSATWGSRIAFWSQFPTPDANGSASSADFFLGTGNYATSSTSFRWVSNVTSNGTQLFVSDNDSSRVLIWNSFPTSNSALPDVVIGQPDFTSRTTSSTGGAQKLNVPYGLYYDSTRLIVSDSMGRQMFFQSQ